MNIFEISTSQYVAKASIGSVKLQSSSTLTAVRDEFVGTLTWKCTPLHRDAKRARRWR